jgi:hypothetical protein
MTQIYSQFTSFVLYLKITLPERKERREGKEVHRHRTQCMHTFSTGRNGVSAED